MPCSLQCSHAFCWIRGFRRVAFSTPESCTCRCIFFALAVCLCLFGTLTLSLSLPLSLSLSLSIYVSISLSHSLAPASARSKTRRKSMQRVCMFGKLGHGIQIITFDGAGATNAWYVCCMMNSRCCSCHDSRFRLSNILGPWNCVHLQCILPACSSPLPQREKRRRNPSKAWGCATYPSTLLSDSGRLLAVRRWMDVKMECPTCRRILPPM